MIGVIDYGAGNLFSLGNALDFLKIPYTLINRGEELARVDGILLPGVGAFSDAMAKLQAKDLVRPLVEEAQKKPFLGICLGLQLLFEYGDEGERTAGLGLLPGHVEHFRPMALPLPHIGWNTARICQANPLVDGLKDESYFYYVHSYHAVCPAELVVLETSYGEAFPGLVARDNIWGAQFHPEKSGQPGLQILKNFGRLVEDGYPAGN